MGMLEGKVAIVTGATSGIGAATAKLFVEEGAKVAFTGRRAVEGQALAGLLGNSAMFVTADATLADDWQWAVALTLGKFGRLDCLFNNAAGPTADTADIGGSIIEVSVKGFDTAMSILVRSVMLGMKHTAPVLVRQGSGSIINNA